MGLLIDTSGFLAAADRDDRHHPEMAKAFAHALSQKERLVTHSMVVTETAALMHRRLGHDVAMAFLVALKSIDVIWVDQPLFRLGLERFRRKSPTDLSLVDSVSFAVMQTLSIDLYIGVDSHFDGEGFARFL
jgi:predicted nucleic acid-binding protein